MKYEILLDNISQWNLQIKINEKSEFTSIVDL